MASVERTIEIIFAGIDRTGGAISSVGSGLTGLASDIEGVAGPLADVTGAVIKFEAAIVAVGAAVLGYSINEAVKFEAAQLGLQRVLGESEGSAKDYTAQILDLSSKYGVSAVEVINSAAQFKQANFTIAESFDLVSLSLATKNTSELSAAQSSEYLKRILAGFAAPASEAARLLNIFTNVSNNAGVTVGQLAEGFAVIGPLAKQMGLGFEEVAALLTPVIKSTGSGSESARALATGFANLIDPTKAVTDVLAQVGISQKGANGELLRGAPLLREIQDRFTSLTPTQQQLVAVTVAGANQFSRLSIVLQETAEQNRVLGLGFKSGTALQDELALSLAATEIQIDRFKAALNNASISLGTQFLPETKGVIAASTDLSDAFRKLVESGKLSPLLDSIRPVFNTIEEIIGNIAKNLGVAVDGLDFTRLTASLGGFGNALTGLFGGVDLSTAEGLQKVLQDIVNIGASLIDFTTGATEALTPFIRELASGASQAGSAGADFAKLLGTIGGFSTAITTITPAIGTLGKVIESLGDIFVFVLGAKLITSSTNVGALTASVGTLVGTLKSAGIIGGAAAGGFLIGELINKIPGVNSAIENLSLAFSDFSGQTDELNTALGQLVFTQEELIRASDYTAETVTKNAVAYAEASKATGELNKEGKLLQEVFNEAGLVLNEATGEIQTIEQASARAAQELDAASQGAGGFIEVIGADGTVTLQQFGTTLVKASGEITKTGQAAQKAATDADKLRVALEEIASNERIKNIEAIVTLNVSQIEADTARIQAAFDSLNTTFTSTGDVISSALSALSGVGGFFGQEQLEIIRQQLEYENKLRAEAAALQKEQVQATIEEIRARTRALRDGGGLIQITSDGLEPALELIMFEILKKVQIRATQSASDFLLGL